MLASGENVKRSFTSRINLPNRKEFSLDTCGRLPKHFPSTLPKLGNWWSVARS